MNLSSLRTMLAPSLASLFLILCLCSWVLRSYPTAGIPIHLYALHPEKNVSGECSARATVLWLTRDGRMWINDYEVAPADLTSRLEEILENRSVRRAYVVADSGLSYGQFADYLNRIARVQPKFDYVLLSGDLRREVENGPTFEGLCDISSPDMPWSVRSRNFTLIPKK